MKFIDIKKTYEGKFLSYYVASYLNRENKIKEYELVSRNKNLTKESFGNNIPAGVGIIAFNEDLNKILIPREYRLATKRWVYNFPGGLIDKGEDAVTAAKRELFEETGLTVTKVLSHLGPSFGSQAISDEMMETVICTCKGEIINSSFLDEENDVKWYTKEEVLKLIENNELFSARTQLFLYTWAKTKDFLMEG